MTRSFGNRPRTRDAKKAAVYMRLVQGRGAPVTIKDMTDAGYRQDEAEKLLASVRRGT